MWFLKKDAWNRFRLKQEKKLFCCKLESWKQLKLLKQKFIEKTTTLMVRCFSFRSFMKGWFSFIVFLWCCHAVPLHVPSHSIYLSFCLFLNKMQTGAKKNPQELKTSFKLIIMSTSTLTKFWIERWTFCDWDSVVGSKLLFISN